MNGKEGEMARTMADSTEGRRRESRKTTEEAHGERSVNDWSRMMQGGG